MTLLEILIAFGIAVASLGSLTRVSAEGLLSTRIATHDEEALSRARSHLAAASIAPSAGQQGGDDGGGFAWQVRTTLVAVAPSTPALFQVEASVSWRMDGAPRSVLLSSRRLAPVTAAP